MRALLISILLLLALGGCTTIDPVLRASKQAVGPFNGGEPIILDAQQVINVLGAAGFTKNDILEYAVPFRRSLATNGGASIRKNGKVVAIFAIFEGEVYISSVSRGNRRFVIASD